MAVNRDHGEQWDFELCMRFEFKHYLYISSLIMSDSFDTEMYQLKEFGYREMLMRSLQGQ